jgi:hypothetical protein
LAAFLDPTSFRHLSQIEKDQAESELKKLHPTQRRSTRSVRFSSNANSIVDMQDENEDENVFEDEIVDTLDHFVQKLGVSKLSMPESPTNIEEELEYYKYNVKKDSNSNHKEFWLRNRELLKLLYVDFLKFNTMCATSVPSECTFSVSGFLQRKERSSLKASTLRHTIMLKDEII